MALTYPPRLRKVILARRARPSQQFGQANDYYTFGGATGCTHTVLQFLIWLWTGKWASHDDISKVANYPLPGRNPTRRGFTPSEVQRVITLYGLPYKVVFGMSAPNIRAASKRGPVGFGHTYGWWPEWKGYKYGGIVADGKPNGFAQMHGRTQLTGFNNGAHFGLLLGVATSPTEPDKVYAWEPNHNSGSRPEDPAYDIMTQQQFDRTYDSYRNVLGRTPYAIVPTRDL